MCIRDSSRLSNLGSGLAQDFDGTNDEGDTPDVDDLSFGNKVTDEPFSLVGLINVDAYGAGNTHIVDKNDSASAEEWDLFLTSDGYPRITCLDESANTTISRSDATAFGTGAWGLLAATYDGSGAAAGLNIWKNAVRVDDTDNSSGTYYALENTSAKVHIGAERSTKTGFFNGKIALVMVVATQLTADQHWAIKEACNSHFGLSL
jgi:hypothetical protein